MVHISKRGGPLCADACWLCNSGALRPSFLVRGALYVVTYDSWSKLQQLRMRGTSCFRRHLKPGPDGLLPRMAVAPEFDTLFMGGMW